MLFQNVTTVLILQMAQQGDGGKDSANLNGGNNGTGAGDGSTNNPDQTSTDSEADSDKSGSSSLESRAGSGILTPCCRSFLIHG